MSKDKENQPNYVFRVLDDTTRYVQELLSENEELRSLLEDVKTEKSQIENQLLAMQRQMDRSREEKRSLEERLARMETENRQFSGRYIEVEQQNANLANLYVASYRLHSTLSRQEVLAVIEEIIINLIGSEEMIIFEIDADRTHLRLAASFGIDAERYRSVPMGKGIIGGVALTGQPYLAEHQADQAVEEPDLTACLPLRFGDTINGAIAIFRLLPQKQGLGSLDYELFDLLGTHAAASLYCTWLHARMSEGVEVIA